MISRSLFAADDAVEDAIVQLDGGDVESAVLSARAGHEFHRELPRVLGVKTFDRCSFALHGWFSG